MSIERFTPNTGFMDTVHQPGDIIADRYRIFAPLGHRNRGMTYEAEDLSEYQRVVMKVFSLPQQEDRKLLEQFEREAEVLNALNHPGIPQYLDYFHLKLETDSRFYWVQTWVAGDSLMSLVQQGWQATEQDVKQIAIQVLEILNYLHQQIPPVIHQDINPTNIIRRPDGQVYLVDLGTIQELYRHHITLAGTTVKTFEYMAPEQFRGQRDCTSDLYSLGMTLLFLLTRKFPRHLHQTRFRYDFWSQTSMSEEFASWLDKLLDFIPEDRFQSAASALQRLQSSSQLIPYGLSRKQPKKPIRLQKGDHYLMIEIPPQGLRPNSSLLLVGVGIWLIALLGLFALPIEDPLINMIFLSISAVGLVPVAILLWQLDGRTRLDINPQRIRVQWKCLDLKYHLEGKTAEITQVKSLKSMCRIWEGDKFYNFAKGRTPEELKWVEREILEAINKIRSS